MIEPPKPTYLVDPQSDPVLVRIEGRASFQNSDSLDAFCAELISKGRGRFLIDFANCPSMDSTFLGVLAGIALDLGKLQPPGSLIITRLQERNLELVRNLGLERILLIDTEGALATDLSPKTALPQSAPHGEVETARIVLAAHENLIAVDGSNSERFQDVLNFLKSRIREN